MLTTRVSISVSIFFVMCRLVWPNDTEHSTMLSLSLTSPPLQTTTTGAAAAVSYIRCTCGGRVSAQNSDVLIVRFVL